MQEQGMVSEIAMSSDGIFVSLTVGSEVWSIESKKTDEQVELEIIGSKPRKVKPRIPEIIQKTPFIKSALNTHLKKGEIVWFNMDGSNWPCIIINAHLPIRNQSKTLKEKDNMEIVKKESFKIWKIWPGASIFRRNIFGHRTLKFPVNTVNPDRVSDSEDDMDKSIDSNYDIDSIDSSDDDFVDQNSNSFNVKHSVYNQNLGSEIQEKKFNFLIQDGKGMEKIIVNDDLIEYDLLPLPLSTSALEEVWKCLQSGSFSDQIISNKLERVSKKYVKPWLDKHMFPVPSDDEARNLSLLQAIHTSCSWSIPTLYFERLLGMEAEYEKNSQNLPFLTISLEYYRHGTEIIHVGDLVRLITNLRQTRNVISNQTTQILYVASLTVVSQLSYYEDSSKYYWNRSVLLYGIVHEPLGANCVSTGEDRTVDTDGICGRWYSNIRDINRKMPANDASRWVV